jgi:hypothetical protein
MVVDNKTHNTAPIPFKPGFCNMHIERKKKTSNVLKVVSTRSPLNVRISPPSCHPTASSLHLDFFLLTTTTTTQYKQLIAACKFAHDKLSEEKLLHESDFTPFSAKIKPF